jgi:DNA polymerase-3 subunit alpha (Gram-positive type)
MPSFLSIEGMGGKAAENMELAALDGPYVSREDIKERTKISQTVLDKLGSLGLLGDLPVSNQFSLADLGLI